MKQKLIDYLVENYPLPHRLFGCSEQEYGSDEWKRRRLVANIIVGGSRDSLAVKGATVLFQKYSYEYMSDRKNYNEFRRAIADFLEIECEIKYAGKKAEYILNTMYALKEQHGGKVPSNMRDLMSLPGVGRHAASVVLGLAFGQQTFGVDIHVRRIVKRLGLVDKKATDRLIEKEFLGLENSTHISRAMMEFGHKICRYRPSCQKCPFNDGHCDRKILK